MVKVAILGFGTVGSGIYEVLRTNAQGIEKRIGQALDIAYILDIRDFEDHPEAKLFTKNFNDILNDKDVSIVAEVIGGTKVAYEFTKKALTAGKSVVTSNKELVATHGAELLKLAEDNGVKYLFEASVGGGIPIIHPMHQCLAANEITEIVGILNGTTNYILTQMIKNGESFDNALGIAQQLGYAEANPAADIEGIDACRKIAILADLAFGRQISPDKIYTEGITNVDSEDVKYAESQNCVIKLIGYCKKDGDMVFARVSPMFVPKESALSGVDDVFNAILVRGNAIGETMFYGRGAGKLPTASAVVSDMIDIARDNCNGIMWTDEGDDFIMDINDSKVKWFVRASQSKVKDAERLFGAIDLTFIKDTEFGFTTPKLTEGELSRKIEEMGGMIKFVRVLE